MVGSVSIHFKNCVIDEGFVNGDMYFTVEQDYHTLQVAVDDLAMGDAVDTISYSGNIAVSEQGIRTENFVATSEKLGMTVKLAGFEVRDRELKARVYLSNYGYVDVSQDDSAALILVKGSDDSEVVLDYNRSLNHFGAGYAQTFDITLEQASSAGPATYTTTTDIANLTTWPYVENKSPVLVLTESVEVDTAVPVDLDARESHDPDDDFLTYAWRLVSVPECEAELTPAGPKQATFQSGCRGMFTAQLTVDDGFNEAVVKEVAIEVLREAAQIAAIPPVWLAEGEELNIPVMIGNEATDGPFELKIAYGPAGVSVSEDGRIVGRPVPFASGSQHQFTIGVEANNGKSTLAEFQVEQSDAATGYQVLPSVEICSNAPVSGALGDEALYVVCPFHQSFQLFRLENGIFDHVYTEMNPPQHHNFLAVGFSRFNADEVDEIVLVYADWIYVVDALTYEIIERIENPLDTDLARFRVVAAPNPYPGFLLDLDGGSDYGIHHYRTETGGFVNLGAQSLIGQISQIALEPAFDASAASTDLYAAIRDFKREDGFDYQLVDAEGDGSLDVVAFSASTDLQAGRDVLTWTVHNLADQSSTSMPPLSVPNENATPSHVYTLLNLDADPEKELLAHDAEYVHEIWVFDKKEGGFTLVHDSALPEACGYHGIMRFSSSPTHVGAAIIRGNQENTFCTFSLAEGFTVAARKDPVFASGPGIPSSLYKGTAGNLEALVSQAPVELPSAPRATLLHLPDGAGASAGRHLFWDLGGALQIYDTETFALLDTLADAPDWNPDETSVQYLNFDKDGSGDLLALHVSGVWVHSFSENTSVKMDFPADKTGYNSFAADLNGDGEVELIRLERGPSPINFEFVLYSAASGTLERLGGHVSEKPGSYFRGPYLSVQDVNSNGSLELLVYYVDEISLGSASTHIEVLDGQMNSTAAFFIPGAVTAIPQMVGHKAKSNIIVLASHPHPSTGSLTSSNQQFWEIDAAHGKVIWRSRPYFGRMAADTFKVLGDDVYLAPKAVVFESGINYFRKR